MKLKLCRNCRRAVEVWPDYKGALKCELSGKRVQGGMHGCVLWEKKPAQKAVKQKV